jgi:hypothetical protein
VTSEVDISDEAVDAAVPFLGPIGRPRVRAALAAAAWRREHELLSRAEAAEAENARLRAQLEAVRVLINGWGKSYGSPYLSLIEKIVIALSDEGKPSGR